MTPHVRIWIKGILACFSLFIIAQLYFCISAEEMKDANKIPSSDEINRGDELQIKYARCPGLHLSSRGDGLNVLKKKLLGYLGEILCIDQERVVLLPPLLNHGELLNSTDGPQFLLGFDKVFDLQVLNRFTYPIRLVADPLPFQNYRGLNQDQEVEYTFRDSQLGVYACKSIIDELPQKITCPLETAQLRHTAAIKSLVSIVGPERALDAVLALQPAPELRKVAENILSSKFPQGRESFMCIHLRTEHDFKTYIKEPPGYYTTHQYYTKLKRHMFKNPQIYKDIKHLFIAGDHSAEHIENVVRPIFGRLFHGDIVGHFNSTLENIQRAAIDQHICVQADIFIGNSYSGFTLMTLDIRKAMNRNISIKNTKNFLINNHLDRKGSIANKMIDDSNAIGYDIIRDI